MMVVGGQAPKAIRSVECYDFKEERWHQVAELPSRRCRAGKDASFLLWLVMPQNLGICIKHCMFSGTVLEMFI